MSGVSGCWGPLVKTRLQKTNWQMFLNTKVKLFQRERRFASFFIMASTSSCNSEAKELHVNWSIFSDHSLSILFESSEANGPEHVCYTSLYFVIDLIINMFLLNQYVFVKNRTFTLAGQHPEREGTNQPLVPGQWHWLWHWWLHGDIFLLMKLNFVNSRIIFLQNNPKYFGSNLDLQMSF